ncbi:MAG: glucose 1-dehydrogenase [Pseudomonadota bacterium]
MTSLLKDQVAIITGGGRGFGAGIAQAFALAGAQVIIAEQDPEAGEIIAQEMGITALCCDISQKGALDDVVNQVIEQFGRIDIFVNNAGVTHLPTPLEEVSDADFERIIAVNAWAVFYAARAVVPIMKRSGAGVILNIASTAAKSPRPGLCWYNASKGWLVTATQSMAIELAPYKIRVNALNPVAGETPLLKRFMGEDTPVMREKFLATIPLGRFSTPQDIGQAARFLCSPEAAMITGVALEVDGGRCI